MAVFINHDKKIIVFTSYKVGYSTLYSQQSNGFKYLHYKIEWVIYKHLIKHFHYKKFMIIRHPYRRYLSLFNDKFRKQPKRILEKLHKWENVHLCMFPYLGLNVEDSDEEIAARFLKMSREEFLTILPKVIDKDEHFQTQTTTKTYRLLKFINIPFKINKYFRIEDELGLLKEKIGVDFSIVKNKSGNTYQTEQLSRKEKVELDRIYAKDFPLGNYMKSI